MGKLGRTLRHGYTNYEPGTGIVGNDWSGRQGAEPSRPPARPPAPLPKSGGPGRRSNPVAKWFLILAFVVAVPGSIIGSLFDKDGGSSSSSTPASACDPTFDYCDDTTTPEYDPAVPTVDQGRTYDGDPSDPDTRALDPDLQRAREAYSSECRAVDPTADCTPPEELEGLVDP